MPTEQEDLKNLTKLGKQSGPERVLEVFPNHSEDLVVTCRCTEFTCYCPLTGQPDFAKLVIEYQAGHYCVESKSLKLYLESFRNEKVFHEHLAEDMASDFMYFVRPIWVNVTVDFNIRGGIEISSRCHKVKKND